MSCPTSPMHAVKSPFSDKPGVLGAKNKYSQKAAFIEPKASPYGTKTYCYGILLQENGAALLLETGGKIRI